MNRPPRLFVIPPQHLGHELHVSRSIICDMLIRGYIEPDVGDSVITGLPDRKFLYEAIFGNERVMDFTDFMGLPESISPPKTLSEYINIKSDFFSKLTKFKDYHIINLTEYAAPPTFCTFSANNEMKEIGYDIPERYYSDDFKRLSQKFNFSSKKDVMNLVSDSNQMFIVIHHRYGAPIEKLNKILAKFSQDIMKVVFSSNCLELMTYYSGIKNLSFTDNLKTYATLLNDPRCSLLISEWSGGGQVSQYTMGPYGTVWYYHDSYKDIFNFTMTHKIYELNSTLGTYFNCWDFKCPSGCNLQHFASFENLIFYGG